MKQKGKIIRANTDRVSGENQHPERITKIRVIEASVLIGVNIFVQKLSQVSVQHLTNFKIWNVIKSELFEPWYDDINRNSTSNFM